MQERWASFGGHIDELRHTIIRSLVIVGAGFLLILGFYQPLLQFFTSDSLNHAESGLPLKKVQRNQIVNQTNQNQLFQLPAGAWIISKEIPFILKGDHVYYRLEPGQILLFEQALHSPLLILGPLEGLTLVFKVIFWLSLAFTAPLWGWVWLQFILPGLKTQERSILFPFLLCSFVCLCLGMALAYYVSLPLSNQYLTAFNTTIGQNAWSLSHYMSYVLLLCMGHAIAAELGLLLLTLVHFRFLSPAWLITKRRYMILIAFIIGAVLTPPDVMTQLLLALPLMGLYEIAIWYAKWRNRSILFTNSRTSD
jgi:sec-independent protein translocase protein TatC